MFYLRPATLTDLPALLLAARHLDSVNLPYVEQRLTEAIGHAQRSFASEVPAAARELLYRAAAKADNGERDLGKYSAMAKLFCSDTAMAVTTEAVQVLGGYGYVTEYPVERMMRDAKITQIYEGTNEIQRVVIARHLAR